MQRILPKESSTLAIPSKWQPQYVLKRINDEDITISLDTRNEILRQLASSSGRYVQIGEYTIMLNAIKSIDPKWGANNIPPRPKEELEYIPSGTADTVQSKVMNQDELDEWDNLFGEIAGEKKV